ncbi:hypothetical protein IKG54_01465 [Candidatus Saccharibacteria bacterium]|nr:hypothetical protein [Candidatus Saccharibacteria bacterium]
MISGTDDVCSNDTTDVNVSIEGAWTVAVSSSGTLNVDVTPKGSGTTSTTTDNVNIYTNTPNGYQLYLNSTTGSTDIYNNSDTEHERNHFIATTGTKDSPITLSSNSWGYSLSSNPTTFSKVETSSSAVDALISTGSKTSGSGDNLGVTYGFKADTKLTPGTYTTSVTYTAVAEVPSYTISSASPNTFYTNDQTNKQVTIVTTTPATELGLGDITARVTDGTNTINLTNCTETTVLVDTTSYRAATCTYPGTLPMGYYNVELTSSWHSATYTLTNGFRIKDYRNMSNITYMQDMNSDICENSPESTTTADNRVTLKDSRDQKQYKISKLADGNCWMVQNLALDGGRILHSYDSNVTQDRELSANVPTNTTPSTSVSQIYSDGTTTTDTYGSYYGNLYNWVAATATLGTESSGLQNIQESVCPLGWHLPDATGENSYSSLYTTLGYPISGASVTQMNVMQQAPWWSPYAGYRDAHGRVRTGLSANVWTRTRVPNDTSRAYANSRDTQVMQTVQWSNGIGVSFPVRCVFGN